MFDRHPWQLLLKCEGTVTSSTLHTHRHIVNTELHPDTHPGVKWPVEAKLPEATSLVTTRVTGCDAYWHQSGDYPGRMKREAVEAGWLIKGKDAWCGLHHE